MQHFEYTVECLQRVRSRLEARLEIASTMQKLAPTGSPNAYLQGALQLLTAQSGPSGQQSKIYSRLISFTPHMSVDDFLTALESDTNSHHQSMADEWEVDGSLARAHLCCALVEREGFQLRVLVYIPVDYPREESVFLLIAPVAERGGKKVAVTGSGDYAKGIWELERYANCEVGPQLDTDTRHNLFILQLAVVVSRLDSVLETVSKRVGDGRHEVKHLYAGGETSRGRSQRPPLTFSDGNFSA